MKSIISTPIQIGLAIFVFNQIANESVLSRANLVPDQYDTPCNIARPYVVKLNNGITSGSGIILKKERRKYLVLTTAHLLLDKTAKYKIITLDGVTHSAKLIARFDKPALKKADSNDIAVLEFKSKNSYKNATLVSNEIDLLGQRVFAAGFPIKDELNGQITDPGFVCNSDGGKVSVVLSRSMQEGYQIGYYIDIAKGMSGGPLINTEGKVVGINGKQSHPINIGNHQFYKHRDGSDVNEPLELLYDSSWAISVETFLLTAPKSLKLPTIKKDNLIYPTKPNLLPTPSPSGTEGNKVIK
jgi:S1-C subfamily serine protease